MKIMKQLVSLSENQTNTTQSSTAETIPNDLLIDIFSRVPSKSIARFRCLSKSWASIFSRPYFTELFLTNSSNHPRFLFTACVDNKIFFFSSPKTLQKDAKNSSLVAATRYQTHNYSYLDIYSSLHGLVCCQDKRGDYMTPVICNPATGEFLTLPVLKSELFRRRIFCGYDPTDKKIKVLSIIANENTSQARVLTLETGKLLWRMIECKYHWPVHSPAQMICIEGFFYYLASIGDDKYVIVCFDVKSDKFSFISISTDDICITASTLINYKGRLGAVHFENYNQRSLCLWLLEEDDDAGINKWSMNIYQLPLSWKKKRNQFEIGFQIVGMTRTCDIVLSPCMVSVLSDPFYVFYYNVERKTLSRSIEIQGLQELNGFGVTLFTFEDYVEDLRLLKSLF